MEIVGMMDASIETLVQEEGRGEDARVTLLLHDWGCFIGYLYAE
jgi:hypothetical protein